MKFVISILLLTLFTYAGTVQAQDSKLGTTRSEDLQLKARIEYEKRNQKQPQQLQKQTPTPRPTAPVENTPGKPAEAAPPAQPIAPTQASPVATSKNVSCKHGNGEVRSLYIETKGQGCELFYSKSGVPKSQARQNNGSSICESVFEKMKATLEKTGFVCESKAN